MHHAQKVFKENILCHTNDFKKSAETVTTEIQRVSCRSCRDTDLG